jgi:hypothetical protein
MSFFFGKKNKSKPEFTGLQTQTSASNLPVPLVWGKTRVAPNIIWQGDFQSHKHTQKTGKGGGGSSSETYTYSASFQLGLCEGEIHDVTKVWKDQSKFTSYSDPKLGFSLFTGTTPQAPWGYMVSNHPSQALGYPGTVHLDVPNYDLGSSNTLGQHSFEVEARDWNTGVGGTVEDADPALIIDEFLVTLRYSVGFPANAIDYTSLYSSVAAPTTGDSAFQTYCRAMGFAMSPALMDQEQASSTLDRWTKLMNTAIVWTGYSLKFIPYGDETIAAHGVTYLPPTDIRFSLTDDDYTGDSSQDPIVMDRVDPADAKNAFSIVIRNRVNEYNNLPVDWRDQALIDVFGYRPQASFNAPEICDAAMATKIVTLMGQREAYIRNKFMVTVPSRFCRIEPMDVGEVWDEVWGTIPVRCIHVQETEEDEYQLELEEYPGTTGDTSGFTEPVTSNTPVNTAIAAAAINTPILFEPPSTLSSTAEVWGAISAGPGGTFDPNWGGAYVWVSADGGVSYKQVGTVENAARQGLTTTALAAYGGSNPDTVHTVGVDLSMSAGELISVTLPEAQNYATLCYLDGEFISFESAVLTSTYHYTLQTAIFRGLYGTTASSHLSGKQFARLDDNIFKYPLPADYIGIPLKFKFQSFNVFGQGVQDLSTCVAHDFTPSGTGYGGGTGGVPTTPTGLSVSFSGAQAVVNWTANPTSDNVLSYKLLRAPGPAGVIGSAALIATVTGTTWVDATTNALTTYTYFLEAVNAVGTSAATAGVDVTTGTGGSSSGGAITAPMTAKGTIADRSIVSIFSDAGTPKVKLSQGGPGSDGSLDADGFVVTGGVDGATLTVHFPTDVITGLSGIVPGALYFLAANGGITTVPPTSGWLQEVGKGKSTTELVFKPKTGELM